MSHAPFPAPLPRISTTMLCGIALFLTAGCHHPREPIPVGPSDPERVNVGYGTQPRRDVTGAIASANAEEMKGRNVGRVEELLEGRFAGVDVVRLRNGEFSLRIRGTRSLVGGEPLFVVDGIPAPLGERNPLRDLAPQQIVRIDVLKDAGSTSAYGSRGANGVVLITTRRER